MFIMIALVVAIISCLFWIYEIQIGLDNANRLFRECKTAVDIVTIGPKIVLGFRAFASDLLITSFFMSFFMVSGVTGFVVGVACSDLFSVWIVIKMINHTPTKHREEGNNTKTK